MIKKKYMMPTMQVLQADAETQILAGSVTSVTSTGLDVDDELVLPKDDDPDDGELWDDAW